MTISRTNCLSWKGGQGWTCLELVRYYFYGIYGCRNKNISRFNIFFKMQKVLFFLLPPFQDDILYMPIVILTRRLVKEISMRDSTVAYPRPLTSNYCWLLLWAQQLHRSRIVNKTSIYASNPPSCHNLSAYIVFLPGFCLSSPVYQ